MRSCPSSHRSRCASGRRSTARRLTYLSLIHDQYLVDMLTERDGEEGRLRGYDALYVTDPCVSTAACEAIRRWVRKGG